ncbi:thiolase [Novosphingobium cyanobacteriorum]|uniref:Thiolase n=1 Tax=Novosphingobium cyanobacteriorum TaxID=3024215 RepID=A0ABT6CKY5_9SPHN|nr:thiolase [Novosphingobium cyanobacteriorum]MDF8334588.1 thiolase [Novosphingobium cyanobacteriorum]
MSAKDLRGRTAFVGAATFGCGEAPGYTAIELAAEAGRRAVDDAGLKLSDIDGLFICLPNDFLSGLTIAEYFGIHPKMTNNSRTGGSAFLTHAEWAMLALDAGLIDYALICYGSNQRTGAGKLVSAQAPSPFEFPYRPNNPVASYALAASRHMHQYGTTSEQLASVAVAARQWANLNPEAFKQGSLSVEDVLATRLVADPLHVADCCLVTDGAAAVVLTRADRAKDARKTPVSLLGAASATWHTEIAQLADLTITAARESGERAFAQAGLTPKDIDVVELYDAFTINTILFLEDLGFCPKGEGGRFVSSGAIGPGGSLPVNTNGGGLSFCHPGMYGLFTLVEAIRQLRGEAGERQIAGAKLALAHGNGGTLSSQATCILGVPETV